MFKPKLTYSAIQLPLEPLYTLAHQQVLRKYTHPAKWGTPVCWGVGSDLLWAVSL